MGNESHDLCSTCPEVVHLLKLQITWGPLTIPRMSGICLGSSESMEYMLYSLVCHLIFSVRQLPSFPWWCIIFWLRFYPSFILWFPLRTIREGELTLLFTQLALRVHVLPLRLSLHLYQPKQHPRFPQALGLISLKEVLKSPPHLLPRPITGLSRRFL